ncbi:baseplate hub protein [Sessilibacter corallicola]|uniref:baseplate hub protein n=1 Tax=Sessilibacter corallicola TaxID=2904075 RepID=UPI001E439CC6|nr:hypothetical protein [Sessilibacter corallicola]MCE2029300.1 hypothetical protein [Sessilibacter corallicola]
MSNYFGRRWAIFLDGAPFISPLNPRENTQNSLLSIPREFKITFDVILDAGSFNSYLDLKIWGLSEQSVQTLLNSTPARDSNGKAIPGKVIELSAGYVDNFGSIFSGRIRNAFLTYDPPSRVVQIIAGSGAIAGVLNKTIPNNSTVVDAIEFCADAMGLELIINKNSFAGDPVFLSGRRLNADPRRELNILARSFDFTYIEDQGQLVVTKTREPREGSVRRVSYLTGMEGIPEITEIGCDVNLRLSPDIKINDLIEVESRLKTFNFSNLYLQDVPANAGSGQYKVFRIKHSGDSWGDLYTTNLECIRPN